MNILTLNYEYPPIGGGAAPISKEIADALVKRGHRVTVITMGYRDLAAHEIAESGVEIYRVPCWRSNNTVCHPWEQFTYLLSAQRRLRQLLKSEKYDVCHTHFIIPTGVIARWLKKRNAIPYVITTHGSDVPGYNQRRFKMLHKLLHSSWKKICEQAQTITAPSTYISGLITKSDSAIIHCRVVPNGINIDTYQNERKENIILAMSRLQPHKGIQRLLHAFAQIPHEGWTVHVAGDGPYRNELEALTVSLALEDHVIFHGWLENKSSEHLALLAKAKVFVLASDFEGLPVSVLEALASDCHVVLSDIDAHYYFKHFGAFYFPAEDVNALAVQLCNAMKAPLAVVPDKSLLSMEYMADSLEEILYCAKDLNLRLEN